MIQIWVALFILFLSFFTKVTKKEGFEEDDMDRIIGALAVARNDRRMRPDQKFAIENALRYAHYIKTGFIKFNSCREESYLFGKGHRCTKVFP